MGCKKIAAVFFQLQLRCVRRYESKKRKTVKRSFKASVTQNWLAIPWQHKIAREKFLFPDWDDRPNRSQTEWQRGCMHQKPSCDCFDCQHIPWSQNIHLPSSIHLKRCYFYSVAERSLFPLSFPLFTVWFRKQLANVCNCKTASNQSDHREVFSAAPVPTF